MVDVADATKVVQSTLDQKSRFPSFSARLSSVDASTLEGASLVRLLEEARSEAGLLAKLDKTHDQRAEQGRQRQLCRMLALCQRFIVNGEFNSDGFKNFARDHGWKGGGKISNPYQPVAKLCEAKGGDKSPKTKSSLTSKYAYALAILIGRGISTRRVVEELAKIEEVNEDGRKYTGLERLVQLYKAEGRRKRGLDEGGAFMTCKLERLSKTASRLIEALYARGLLDEHDLEKSLIIMALDLGRERWEAQTGRSLS